MICGRPTAAKTTICEPCQEKIRREALGEQADVRADAEKELRRHGVSPAGRKPEKP